MIKVSVLYPSSPDAKFDMDYYLTKHVPMAAAKLGGACKGGGVDQGRAGGAPGEAPPFVAMAYLLFDSLEDFQAAFLPNADTFMEDMPNYTNIKPILQISEVMGS